MMKKILFLFGLLLPATVAHGETLSDDFLADGMRWMYRGHWATEEYVIDGSKAMNGKEYRLLTVERVLYDSRTERRGSSGSFNLKATIGIREEGGLVYVDREEYLSLTSENYHWGVHVAIGNPLPYETTAGGEIVLYDFNKKEGDIYWQTPDGTVLTVTKASLLNTEDGMTRRCLTLSNGYELIEGMGCINSPGMLLFWLNTKPGYGDVGVMTLFSRQSPEGNRNILAQDFEAVINKQEGRANRMLKEGRRWVYDYDNGLMKGALTYRIEGDTLLHAYRRTRIGMTLVDKQTNKVVRSGYAGAFLEKLGYLYYLAPGNAQDETIYCFGPNMQRLNFNGYPPIVVDTDDITVNGSTFKRLLLINRRTDGAMPREKDSLYYWVEGIGSSKGLLESKAGALADSIRFVACYDGDDRIFSQDDFMRESGQPSTFGCSLDEGPLRYYVTWSSKTASVVSSEAYQSMDSIAILPSIRLWDVDCPVDRIENFAFNKLEKLLSIEIPDCIKEIGYAAFEGCTSLVSVPLPSSVVTVGESAFKDCTGLTAVVLPLNIVSIGKSAFYGCSALTEIAIPNGVEEIKSHTFSKCKALVSVSLPEGLVSIGDASFEGCTSLQSLPLPGSLKTIGKMAFRRCSGLSKIDFPASLTDLGASAFLACATLKDVYCRASTPPNTSEMNPFIDIDPKATLHVPAASLDDYSHSGKWALFKSIVPIDDVTSITIQKVQPSSATDTQPLYDLQGRRCNSKFIISNYKKGVYIQNGRKVVR